MNTGARSRQVVARWLTMATLVTAGTCGCATPDPCTNLRPDTRGGGFLVVPAGGVITLMADSQLVDGETTIVEAMARDADGVPVVDGTQIVLTATAGSFSIPAEEGDGFCEEDAGPAVVLGARGASGAVEAVLQPTPGPATIELRATSGNESAEKLTIDVEAAPAGVQLFAAPEDLGPDGGTTTLSALVSGASGEGVAGVGVALASDRGTFPDGTWLTTDEGGMAVTSFETSEPATVTAALAASGAFETEMVIDVPAPVILAIAPDPLVWNPDGGNTVTLSGLDFAATPLVFVNDELAVVVEGSEFAITAEVLPSGGAAPTSPATFHVLNQPSGLSSEQVAVTVEGGDE